MASPYAGAPALKYGDVNTVTPSPSEVKGLNLFYLSFEKNWATFWKSIKIDFIFITYSSYKFIFYLINIILFDIYFYHL